MTRYQRARRYAFWRGFIIALFIFTGWIGLSAWGGYITAEQPATAPIVRGK